MHTNEYGAKLVDVQHGGGYGMWYNFPDEKLAIEKDYCYSWGWDLHVNKRIKIMPSPYLSSLNDIYSSIIDKMLFIGTRAERYEFRTSAVISSDDVSRYLKDI